jgi:hypothetical protein
MDLVILMAFVAVALIVIAAVAALILLALAVRASDRRMGLNGPCRSSADALARRVFGARANGPCPKNQSSATRCRMGG